jgi:DNA-binding LacI/PurR family transcriptional regulator
VPGDLSVVGIDDIAAAGQTHPPLTTVAFDKERMGRKLA